LRYVCMELANKCKDSDVIVWLDSRGFLFGTMVAEYLWKPFVMIRKKWKLPWKVLSQDYWLEYGRDIVELQEWSVKKGQKVSLIDDLLATGWTIKAGIDLIEKSWWEVNNVSFVISLDDSWLAGLDSRKKLEEYNCNSIVSYD
jgi:adenine phosphoribosyltransferase